MSELFGYARKIRFERAVVRWFLRLLGLLVIVLLGYCIYCILR